MPQGAGTVNRSIAAMSPDQHAAVGDCILVAWAGAIEHMAKLVEAAHREGFAAAQLGTADAGTAWAESEAKGRTDANLRVASWAIKASGAGDRLPKRGPGRPRKILCGCRPEVVRRVQAGGTCGMGGCPYGGDF